ncbi:MAG: hypothetical protein NTX79_08070 [Candidatus Micrarchaeota archaeon]|nr:hypothetical protein [Candidatus Micrarchaeota archaeon]
MRRVVGAIALLFIAFFLILFIPFPANPPQQAQANESAQAGFGISSAEIADAGANASQVAVLRLRIFSDGSRNLSAFCSPLPMQNNILLLSFPRAPGVNASLPLEISAALMRSGLSSREATLPDALSSENTLIISPTGAIPLPLLQNASALEALNSRVLVLEALSGKTIDENGNLAAWNARLPGNFGLVRLSPSDDAGAVAETVERAIFLAGAASASISSPPGNITLVVPLAGSVAYCRAACYQGNGRYRFSDSGKLSPPPGNLIGPASLASGQAGIYEFSLPDGNEVGRNLRFFAVAYLPEGEAFRREIAGGEITQGWASRFQLNFSRGGKYVVRVMDQFARVHASAFVQVPALSVMPMSADGGRYEFLALLDNVAAEGAMSARLDNGTPKNYSVHEGRLVIWSAPSPGNHTLVFEFSGSHAGYPFISRQSGMGALVDTYLRFGVPAAIFVLAVFLLLRAGRRAKYSITFPEVALSDPAVAGVSAGEVISAYDGADRKFGGFSLPCYPQEIAAELGCKANGRGELPINAHSVLCILRKLSSEGVFAEHEGAFIPRASMGGFCPRELLMLRAIHECMLERGLRFSRKRVIAVKKGELELALFRGRKSALSGIGKACRAIIFESNEELEKFTEELAAPGFENSRIRLASDNDKIVFVVASRGSLGGILP